MQSITLKDGTNETECTINAPCNTLDDYFERLIIPALVAITFDKGQILDYFKEYSGEI